MAKPDDPEHLVMGDWITPWEAAQLIGVTPHQVRHLARKGIVASRRFGRAWMINKASAEAYAASERKPGPKPEEPSASA